MPNLALLFSPRGQLFRTVSGLLMASFLPARLQAQGLPLTSTGFLPDAAEEQWPMRPDTLGRLPAKSRPWRAAKGAFTWGGQLRETYENYQGYYWGLGQQDRNGYFLQRILVHADGRWNARLRLYGELQSSLLWGRNGGPRPVQDLNQLAVQQLFGEVRVWETGPTSVDLRFGKQVLHYGQGTLLDLRDANVRRSFVGVKAILRRRALRVDAFLMRAVQTQPGLFDDQADATQQVGGIWVTQRKSKATSALFHAYYLVVRRVQSRFTQGVGPETRHTVGAAWQYRQGVWSGYSEVDGQAGTFAGHPLAAWKAAQQVTYTVPARFAPAFSLQAAISSGDANAQHKELQTFNPLYPKAIYYGFIDNIGSANVVLVHPKAEVAFLPRLRVVAGYYRFWRQSTQDGLYAPNGAYLLPALTQERAIGQMLDGVVSYGPSAACALQLTSSYFIRGPYLRGQPGLKANIFFTGLRATLTF
ncbi:alginate export family protein [Hymenobacter sp. YC55]|uniref:alginate export family protein n=1 Tax=Hymenobacter sp. YC55 TaxID=3034019 RepID=UPI0023F6E30D|nr:alginate export family protein [Hymenobacter sp. YC55]MDF7815881.1 alginate export family protein [Hymenobacter sp. YC55]